MAVQAADLEKGAVQIQDIGRLGLAENGRARFSGRRRAVVAAWSSLASSQPHHFVQPVDVLRDDGRRLDVAEAPASVVAGVGHDQPRALVACKAGGRAEASTLGP